MGSPNVVSDADYDSEATLILSPPTPAHEDGHETAQASSSSSTTPPRPPTPICLQIVREEERRKKRVARALWPEAKKAKKDPDTEPDTEIDE